MTYDTSKPETWDYAPLKESLRRLENTGIVSSEDLSDVSVMWGHPYFENRCWLAYCYPEHRKIIMTHKVYNMPKWAIDTIMWHELAHVFSKEDHGDRLFKIIRRRRRRQAIQEVIVLTLDKLGVYRRWVRRK